MKATVDHRARKQVIIANAIRLFARHGYNDVTFQDLADSCGVARTILYRYFKNKRQIFDAAILLAMQKVVQKHAEIMHAKLPASVRLRQICTAVTATLFDNREFLAVIIDFVMAMKRGNHDMTRRIMTFTIGLKRILHTLLAEGIRLPFVWNSSGYETVETLAAYRDLCDIALVDMRYASDATARA